VSYNGKTFKPCFANKSSSDFIYPLNVTTAFFQNTSGKPEGSVFIQNLRDLKPFEAYIVVDGANAPAYISIFDEGAMSGVYDLPRIDQQNASSSVYSLSGQKLTKPCKGINIVNGRKVLVR
jgi:hypothetical protein